MAKAGDYEGAGRVIAELVRAAFGLAATTATINRDQYSLNSLNGIVAIGDGSEYFFKFHQEEGEGDTVAEYYRAETLREAGYPVDVPAYASREVGRQILLYRRRHDRRFADLCRAAELDGAIDTAPLIRAQEDLDRIIGERYLATLHSATADEAAAEPVHRLFHARLVDPGSARAPRRPRRAVLSGPAVRVPGADHAIGAISATAAGASTASSIRAPWPVCSRRAGNSSRPRHFAGAAVVAHGDAHNANVWCEDAAERGAAAGVLRSRLCRRPCAGAAGGDQGDIPQHLRPSVLALRCRGSRRKKYRASVRHPGTSSGSRP